MQLRGINHNLDPDSAVHDAESVCIYLDDPNAIAGIIKVDELGRGEIELGCSQGQDFNHE